LLELLQGKLKSFTNLALEHDAGSYFEIPTYDSLLDLIQYLPFALYNVFVRPIFPENINALSLLSILENLALILLFILAISTKKVFDQTQKQWAWYYAAIVLPLVLLIGSTVPVLGALVRYKIVFLPFYLALLLTFADLGKLPLLKKLK
jgi:hypothetical protein